MSINTSSTGIDPLAEKHNAGIIKRPLPSSFLSNLATQFTKTTQRIVSSKEQSDQTTVDTASQEAS